MKEEYEFADMSSEGKDNSRTHLATNSPSPSHGGCHVSTATGFVLALLAILIAVGVGVIVHFAGPARSFECHCNHPESRKNTVTPEAQWQACVTMAKTKDHCLVPDCPGGRPLNTTTTLATTTKEVTKEVSSGSPLSKSTTFTTTTEEVPKEVPSMRLPTALLPVHYRLVLEPRMYMGSPENFTFRGSVDILIDCVEATNNITLHIKKLEIVNNSILLSGASGASAPGIVNYELDTAREFIIFNLDRELTAGSKYSIKMAFSGPLKDDLAGLYLSSYQQDNQTVYLATTQFSSTEARKAFPCFDEPALKATFDITLVRKNDYNSISNMPIVSSDPRGSDMTADVFNTTAKMSTYLLAMLVSKFEGKQTRTQRGVQVGVWSRPEALSQADNALQFAVKILDFYESYYDMNFPLPKLDNAAIPDFAYGGMENWGLICYRETAMLFDPAVSTSKDSYRLSVVVAHELAHQWFGNLVTPAWWDDVWLKEGFASFVEHIGRNHVHPEWRVFELFLVDQLQNAFNLDGLKSSHPIYVPVNQPNEIKQIFDSISYNKGASILRMLELYLGEGAFQRGIKRYLQGSAFDSADHNKLWEALDAERGASPDGITIKEMMDTWILQMNYPVVTVNRSRDHAFTVSQSRFLLNPDTEESQKYASPYDYKWDIPFTFTTSVEKDFNTSRNQLMRKNAGQEEIANNAVIPEWHPDTRVIANVRQAGFYRVNYDEANWNALIHQLKEDHNVISVENRAQIINDAWNLAKAGLLDPKLAMQTVAYLEEEESYVPWRAAVSELNFVETMLSRTGVYGSFQSYLSKLIKKQYYRVGWEAKDGNLQESLAQTLILERACRSGVLDCVTKAKWLYAEWMNIKDANSIPVELKSVVYCTAIAHGGQAEWDFGYKIYQETNVGAERDLLQNALACSSQTWILSRYLSRCLDVNQIRKQDALNAIGSIARNTVGRALAWDFVRQHWDILMERYGSGMFGLPRMVLVITEAFNTEFDLQQLKDFMKKTRNLGTAKRAFDQAVEKIQTNIKWMDRIEGVIDDWRKDRDTGTVVEEVTDVRLPTSLIPIEYTVELKPDFYKDDPKDFSLEGYVSIRMMCEEATQNITLHIKGLDIDENSIKVWTGAPTANSGAPIGFNTPIEDKDRQFFILPLERTLTQGQVYYLSMNFTGPLKYDEVGLFLRHYKRGNQTVYVTGTHFQAPYARKAFPCFDEPALKAHFNIILLRKPNLISLSNMPIVRTDNRSEGFVADVYNTTVKMSTYLLAFAIGDFAHKEQMTATGVKFRVYARPDAIDQADYALETGVKILDYFETYFDIPFPMPKLDMIAIPGTPGAMENWGLIRYGEDLMLYDPLVSSASHKELVATVVSHELAHMWFGNLVTLRWWDDLWLNEGFATFLENIGVDHAHKDWKTTDKHFFTQIQEAFRVDAVLTSHPLYTPVGHPDKIFSSSISYFKGGVLINMMKAFLGESTFLKGLQNYLKDWSYKSVSHDQLWSALSEQSARDGSNIDIKSVMDTWILQMNYPVITFNRSGDTVTVSQQRYLQDSSAKDPGKYPSPYGYMWEVPVTFTTNLEMNFTNNHVYWLGKNQTSVSITEPTVLAPVNDGVSWVIGNLRLNCYYRVNYDSDNWAALISQLKRDHKIIHPLNRAQIISDSRSLAKSGFLDQLTALRVTEYLSDEDESLPFMTAVVTLDDVRDKLLNTVTFGAFRDYLKTMFKPLYEKVGWDNTDVTSMGLNMRKKILSVACENGYAPCVMEAKKQFADWMKDQNNNQVDPNFRDIVYCTAIKHGGTEEWDFAYRMFKQTNVHTEATHLLSGMACSREHWILARYLERILMSEKVDTASAVTCITTVANNPNGQSLAWDFLRANWDYLKDVYRTALDVIQTVTSRFNTVFQLKQLQEFMAEKADEVSVSVFREAMDQIRSNIEWRKNNEEIISDWLNPKGPDIKKEKVTDVRLPLSVYPVHYDLELNPDIYGPDPATFTFEGHVKIRLNCRQATDNLTLHVNKLTYGSVSFEGLDGCAAAGIQDVTEDKDRQFLIVNFIGQLVPGCNYSLEINFTGPLKVDLAGLYLSSYKKGNDTVYIATSQLEPTDARKAFPCFDEPAIKSTFNVTLVRQSHMKSLSNMEIQFTEDRGNGYLADVYGTTPKMSTYLLAFVVCDFAYKENQTQRGTVYRVWAREDAIDQADYALGVGIRISEYFEEYFNVSYPLPKQDMVAVPDFRAAAMENWGLIIYRESAMLYDPLVSTKIDKRGVATIVSHELAHQWFGNLVTPRWWDDLWLNEGFATYVHHMGVDVVEPTWKMFEQFVITSLRSALYLDSLTIFHPVYAPVNRPDEINSMFGGISYLKGASIIRMMRFFLGDDTFRRGLTKYLTRLQYDVASHDDLWQALTEQSEEDATAGGFPAWNVKEVMDTWILQMNYPVVTLNRTGQPVGSVQITQSRFLLDYTAPEDPRYPSPFNYRWNIPLTIASNLSLDFNTRTIYLINRTEDVRIITDNSLIPPIQSTGWIIGNARQFGYYRVNYDMENWLSLIAQLHTDHTVIDPINRAQIINDAWTLVKAGLLDLNVALGTIGYLGKEESYIPWAAASSELSTVDLLLSKSSSYGAFSAFMKQLSESAYSKLSWDITGDHLTDYIRAIVFGKACWYGVEGCVNNATMLYREWMNDPSGKPVHQDLKSIVYCTAIRTGGATEWDFAYSQYKSSSVESEKYQLLSALGCASDIWILNRYLQHTLDPQEIRREDTITAMTSVSGNPIGRFVIWDFVVSQWNGPFEGLPNAVGAVISSFNTEAELQKLEKFMADHQIQETWPFPQAVKMIKSNIDWMKKNFDVITDWLDQRGFR